ncbi:MAG: hypothetical protein LEGION0398_MBIBDBAK_00968 [Legionellaceae bacterium]
MKKIIVVFPERLGDAIFCTPALALLKQYSPLDLIDAIVMSPITADMLKNNPGINKIFIMPNEDIFQSLHKSYDVAINLHYGSIRDEQLSFLADHFISIEAPDFNLHQSLQALAFIQYYVNYPVNNHIKHSYCLYPKKNDEQRILNFLNEYPIDAQLNKLIGLHLGCHRIANKKIWKIFSRSTHKKVWPIKKFIKLAKTLLQQNPHFRFVLTGSNSEQYLAKKFLTKIPQSIDLIGKTSVLELTALMNYLNLYITSDTGPLHVACATDVNLIALFGSHTSFIRTGPYPPKQNQKLVYHSEIAKISVNEVIQSIHALLASRISSFYNFE